ncbi:Tether containing UBX domain for GLUT4-like [Oopsacas minuta]|uniref:Tether containing UBX domain for GLUT4-like n=1 Tax=Oopsacas minuta TaxID=111878 RepID=A0AAV7K0B6_9METZ|nr:Tether containing UBX domain for GLUT4-like [Oopsacas minuta]
MFVKLTIVSPRGYRVVLKVNTNSALCLPLEEACTQFTLESNKFGLKHLKRCLDVCSTVRQSNLPNNCTLELYRLDKERVYSAIRIALLLPDGSRLMGIYEASIFLWEVISAAEAEEGSKIPLCYPGGDPVQVPCVEYSKVRVIGEEELRTRSLKNLGILSGSAILRYSTVSLQDVPKTICDDVIVLKGHHQSTPISPTPDVLSSKPGDKPGDDQIIQPAPTETALFPSPQTSVFGEDPSLSNPYLSSVMKTPWSFDQQIEEEEKRRKEEMIKRNPKLFSNPEGWEHDKGPFDNIDLGALLTQAVIPVVPPEEDYITQFNIMHSEKTGIPLDSNNNVDKSIPTPAPPAHNFQKPKPIERVYEEPCPRNTVVFHLDKNEYSDVFPAEIDDSFFQPSMSEVMDRQSTLSQALNQLHDSPITTQAYKKNQKIVKVDKYESTIIRVVLPNRLVLQGVFRSGEPVKSLVGYIRSCSVDPTTKFHLFTTPPKKVIKNGKVTFNEANLVPACNLYLALEDGDEDFMLREDLLDQVSTQLEADIRSSKERGVFVPTTPPHTQKITGSRTERKQGKNPIGNTNQGKPKWFKVGK